MSTTSVPRPLLEAQTLPQLLLAARNCGFEEALSSRAAPLFESPSLRPDTRELLARVASATDVVTMNDFLSPGRVQGLLGQLPGPERARLVDVARKAILAVSLPPPPPKPAPPAPPPKPRALPDPDAIPDSRAALLEWARPRGAVNLIELPARTLIPTTPGLRMSWDLEMIPLGDLIGDQRGLRFVPKETRERLRRAAWRFLQDEAAKLQAMLEAERAAIASPPPPLADATLQQLVEKVAEARAKVRRAVSPERGASGRLRLELNPLVAHFQAAGPAWFPDSGSHVTINLEGWADAPLAPFCNCGAGYAKSENLNRCGHVLLALDALSQYVRANATTPDGQKLSESLRQPSWARLLDSLDLVRAKVDRKENEELRLSWKLDAAGGVVSLVPQTHRRLKRGGFSAGSRMSWAALTQGVDEWSPADRRAVAALFPDGQPDVSSGGGLPQPRVYRALARLAGSHDVTCADCGAPVTLRTSRLGMAAKPGKGDEFTLVPTVGDEPLEFEELRRLRLTRRNAELILRYDGESHVAAMIHASDAALALLDVFAARPVPFPAASFGALFQHAEALQEQLPISLPAAVKGEELPADTTLIVRLKPLPEAGIVAHLLARPLAAGSAFTPGAGPRELIGTIGARRVHVRRDPAGEVTRARELIGRLALPVELEGPDFTFTVEQPDDALDLIAKLQTLTGDGLSVEWPDKPRKVTRPASVKNVRLKITESKDWFGLAGEAQVDDARVELAVLLDALRQRRRYVEVKEGMWLALSDSLREKLTPLADQASGNERTANLGLAGALTVEALADQVGEFEAVEGFGALLGRIREARTWEPVVPKELKSTLRDYQVAGFKWLARLASWGAGACLADDMGLGKTIQALALLSHRGKAGPALVVAPTSVCGNWIREAKRFAPSLKPVLYRELPGAQRAEHLRRLRAGDLLVTSYGLLVRDAERFAEVKLSTLVLDESQAIKNADTLRSKAARLIQADFKVALTGTPLENHVGELWSLYRVIFPGLFGSWDEFRNRFARRDDTPETDRKNSVRAALARQVRPFLLRRTKQEVAPELPSRTEMEEHIDLSPTERRLYEDARLAAVAKLTSAAPQPEGQQRFEVLAALTRLRLCASHPAMYDPTETAPSSKLNRFLEIVSEITAEDHRALVFSQFTKHLALVREALDKRGIPYLYLDGETPPSRRDELVDAFQAGAAPLFLISLKAGGTGLNLTAADYVLHLDPWWNPAVEDQATDRAHRIGQTRPVTVIRLVARGTIEEQILSLHASKRTLVADVLEGTNAAAKVSTSELIDLIKAGASAADGDDSESEEPEAAAPSPSKVKTTAPALEAPIERKAEPVHAESASAWPWLGEDATARGLASFRAGLALEMAAGSISSYLTAARRFMDWMQTGRSSEPFKASAEAYLAAILSDEVPGGTSEYKRARAMIRKLGAFVEMEEEDDG